MILYWYIHWFWITILIVYTSVAQKLEQQESTTHSKKSNDSNDSTHSVDQNISNKTKSYQLVEESITIAIPPVNILANRSTSSANDQAPDNTTYVSVIEANVTSVSTASLLSNSSVIDNETLTTLETAYREASDNESMTASDRIVITDDTQLSAAGITSITLGCVVLVAIVCSLSYVWYRNRGFNRPQVLTDRSSNLDSSGYIDDTSDNSEEMYSLDNDSFLNSLEAMTIQNYWTDTVKHTKL